MECKTCGPVQQRDAPGEELLAALYSTWLLQYRSNTKRKFEKLSWALGTAKEVANGVAAIKRTPSFMRVRNFCIGWGRATVGVGR
jgi:hypothetical protein